MIQNFETNSQKVISIVSAITDFRDTNDLIALNGSEAKEYKNAAFDSIEELEQVLGVTDDLYQNLLPFVTVYNKRNGIDPTVASPFLLENLSAKSTRRQAPSSFSNHAKTSSTSQAYSVPSTYIVTSTKKYFRIISAVETKAGGRYVRDTVIELKRLSNSRYVMKRWLRGNWPEINLKNSPSIEIKCN